jgi:hypothetical protein
MKGKASARLRGAVWSGTDPATAKEEEETTEPEKMR